jgi:hypothetical protein
MRSGDWSANRNDSPPRTNRDLPRFARYSMMNGRTTFFMDEPSSCVRTTINLYATQMFRFFKVGKNARAHPQISRKNAQISKRMPASLTRRHKQ